MYPATPSISKDTKKGSQIIRKIAQVNDTARAALQ